MRFRPGSPASRVQADPELGYGLAWSTPRAASCHDSHVSLVLIVDDHADFRRLARRILERAGFSVAEAGTGAEAVAAVGELRPDAVLLDIQLPDFDGFAVVGRLVDAGHRVAVVLTSSREASDYADRIASSSVAGFLPKTELSGPAFRTLLAKAG